MPEVRRRYGTSDKPPGRAGAAAGAGAARGPGVLSGKAGLQSLRCGVHASAAVTFQKLPNARFDIRPPGTSLPFSESARAVAPVRPPFVKRPAAVVQQIGVLQGFQPAGERIVTDPHQAGEAAAPHRAGTVVGQCIAALATAPCRGPRVAHQTNRQKTAETGPLPERPHPLQMALNLRSNTKDRAENNFPTSRGTVPFALGRKLGQSPIYLSPGPKGDNSNGARHATGSWP